jgi:hypothetical protein
VRFYAGIGSRQAPDWALELAEEFARRAREKGWTLRSGHAPGMDQAFERGAEQDAEVYLPWPQFESKVPCRARYVCDHASRVSQQIASGFHPNWENLSNGARCLHGRNVHQVLGPNLEEPKLSIFVLCWTPEGRGGGGTGQAIRIAQHYGVPVYDLANPHIRQRVEGFAF